MMRSLGFLLETLSLRYMSEQKNLPNQCPCRSQRGAKLSQAKCLPAQSFDLTRDRPSGFAVLTEEDAFFHAALAQGADGGVLASAHVRARAFAVVRDLLNAGDQAGALAAWRVLAPLPRLLFAEPSPAPIKHWLWRAGLIDSPEVRLPMTGVTEALGARLDQEIARTGAG